MSVTLPLDTLTDAPAGVSLGLTTVKTIVGQDIESFLKEVERRAFRLAQLSLRNTDDALDVVQEAMLQLVRHYSNRPAAEWPPLFYRILNNRIRDAQRRRRTRNRFVAWWTGGVSDDDEGSPDPIDNAPADQPGPADLVAQTAALGSLEVAIQALPARQREAFLLRALEGLDLASTARAMGCSEGSVKTHYFRALNHLRSALGEHWS